jgi:hypothetical protein
MTTYHLSYVRAALSWRIRKEKTEMPIMHHADRNELLERFAEWANKTATDKNPIALRIHAQDGKIQEERIYPRSADPKGSRG